MAHIRIAQGGEQDIFFALKTKAGGSLTDDDDWVDGSTAGQWPTAVLTTQGGSPVDVTSQVVKDITADVIADATHKHPDGTTGLWRRSKGKYALRALPSLAVGDYDLTITYDINGFPYPETHTVSVVEAGDVDFGDGSAYTTEAVVLANFDLADVVTSAQVATALTSADRIIHSYLEGESIDPLPWPGPEGLYSLEQAAITLARAELRRGNTSLAIPSNVRRLQEGDTTIDMFSADKVMVGLHMEAVLFIEKAIAAILGVVFFSTGVRDVRDQSV